MPVENYIPNEFIEWHGDGNGFQDEMAESDVVGLVKEAAREASELARLEVELARREMRAELLETKRAARWLALSASSAFVGLSLFLSLLANASKVAAVALAVVAFVAGGAAGALGFRRLPRAPLDRTRRRLVADANDLKAKIA